MPVITNPTLTVYYFGEINLRGDEASAKRYCQEIGKTYISHKVDALRFSNGDEGSRIYQYWNGTAWVQESGFKNIVTEITHS